MKLNIRLIILLIAIITTYANAQVENVPISNPVYDYLIRMEATGLLPNFSTSNLPLQRKEVANALQIINEKSDKISESEINTLKKFLKEFDLLQKENAVVFYSSSDDTQVLSSEFFSEKEKYFYKLKDSSKSVSISPLGSIEYIQDTENNNVSMGNLGFRFYGSLGEYFGYYLQATNGVIISGDNEFALKELHKLKQNVKFADLDSDFDFSESHVNFNYDWFFASIGRQNRLLGSGISSRLFVSDNSPPQDNITLSSKFKTFEYTFSHSSILATDMAEIITGFNSQFPNKYLVQHRFAVKPSWGEIAFWEGIIYGDRGFDIAYLNPLSFFKSLEHALHDRDNSLMGGDITVRPFDRFQIKGSFLLDDIKFGEIGKGYWSNKTAWNLGATYVTPFNIDVSAEYTRIEPYTFTHFNPLLSYTNDEFLIGTGLLPNSDETALIVNYWWGCRYPITLKLSYLRHGDNVVDEEGNIIKNVGGNPFQTRRPEDSETISFLDGDLSETFNIELSAGFEIVRGFNIKAKYKYRDINTSTNNIFFIGLSFEDF